MRTSRSRRAAASSSRLRRMTTCAEKCFMRRLRRPFEERSAAAGRATRDISDSPAGTVARRERSGSDRSSRAPGSRASDANKAHGRSCLGALEYRSQSLHFPNERRAIEACKVFVHVVLLHNECGVIGHSRSSPLVNVREVKRSDSAGALVLTDGTQIAISRSRRPDDVSFHRPRSNEHSNGADCPAISEI